MGNSFCRISSDMGIIKENEYLGIYNRKDLQMIESIKDSVKGAIFGKE